MNDYVSPSTMDEQIEDNMHFDEDVPKGKDRIIGDILDNISGDLCNYLLAGSIEIRELPGCSLLIDDLESVLRIHYAVTQEMCAFIDTLKERIRRIKTITHEQLEEYNGDIKGSLSWAHTIRERNRRGQFFEPIFVCKVYDRKYNIPENIILKSLLKIILDIDKKYFSRFWELEEKYDWVKNANQIKSVKDIYEKNIYLQRISIENVKITDRMLNNVLRSRNPLYRDSALLFKQFNKISRCIDDEEARLVLSKTFINPDDRNTVFELYWVIMIIRKFRELHGNMFKMKLMDSTNGKQIAEWEHEKYKYSLYHNKAGISEDLCFIDENEKVEKIKSLLSCLPDDKTEVEYLKRDLKSTSKYLEIIKKTDSRSGRPDIILVKRNKSDASIVSILIGEVKFSGGEQTVKKGLRDLLWYVSVGQEKLKFIEEYDDLFEDMKLIVGGLFTTKISSKLKLDRDKMPPSLRIMEYGSSNEENDLTMLLSDFDDKT